MLETCTISVDTVGEDGSATGAVTSGTLTGYIYDIYLNYHATAPGATTDVTIAYATPAGGNILVNADSATDALFMPRKAACDNAASALTWYDQYYINGTLTVTVAQCNALTAAVTATIRYDPNERGHV